MNDKFLRNYRITPRAAFSHDLRKRLEIHEGKTLRERNFRIHPIALGTIAFLLVFVITLVVSPAARAQVQEWVGMIGGVLFTATGDYPGGDGPVTIVSSNEMSLDEARAVLPFTVDLPAWVPEGYVLEETVSIPRFLDGKGRVFIHWDATQKPLLELEIEDHSPEESNWVVGEGSIEEVLVDGEPAALVRGGWNADAKQWEDRGQIHLYVSHKGLTYIFSTIGNEISIDELIRIAESLP
jgi:hypothetical protein